MEIEGLYKGTIRWKQWNTALSGQRNDIFN